MLLRACQYRHLACVYFNLWSILPPFAWPVYSSFYYYYYYYYYYCISYINYASVARPLWPFITGLSFAFRIAIWYNFTYDINYFWNGCSSYSQKANHNLLVHLGAFCQSSLWINRIAKFFLKIFSYSRKEQEWLCYKCGVQRRAYKVTTPAQI